MASTWWEAREEHTSILLVSRKVDGMRAFLLFRRSVVSPFIPLPSFSLYIPFRNLAAFLLFSRHPVHGHITPEKQLYETEKHCCHGHPDSRGGARHQLDLWPRQDNRRAPWTGRGTYVVLLRGLLVGQPVDMIWSWLWLFSLIPESSTHHHEKPSHTMYVHS